MGRIPATSVLTMRVRITISIISLALQIQHKNRTFNLITWFIYKKIISSDQTDEQDLKTNEITQ